MRALLIRQPYAELILRTCGRRGTCGEQIKPIEFRSRPTKRIGERFYIYASRQWAEGKLLLEGCRVEPQIPSSKSQSNPNDQIPGPKLHVPVIGDNIEVPTEGPQPWMLIAEASRGETPMILFQSSQMENGFDRLSCFNGGQQLCTSGIGARFSDVTRANHVLLQNSHKTKSALGLY